MQRFEHDKRSSAKKIHPISNLGSVRQCVFLRMMYFLEQFTVIMVLFYELCAKYFFRVVRFVVCLYYIVPFWFSMSS